LASLKGLTICESNGRIMKFTFCHCVNKENKSVALTSKKSKLIHDWENNDFLQLSFFTLIFLKQYYSWKIVVKDSYYAKTLLDHPIAHYKEGLEWLHIQHVQKIVTTQKWKLFKDLQVFNESLASFSLYTIPNEIMI